MSDERPEMGLRRSRRRRSFVPDYRECESPEWKVRKRRKDKSPQSTLTSWLNRSPSDFAKNGSPREKFVWSSKSEGGGERNRSKFRKLDFYGMRFKVKGFLTHIPEPKYRQLKLSMDITVSEGCEVSCVDECGIDLRRASI